MSIGDDEFVTLPSGERVNNIIEIIKYIIFPEFFGLLKPKNYTKVVRLLNRKIDPLKDQSKAVWISL